MATTRPFSSVVILMLGFSAKAALYIAGFATLACVFRWRRLAAVKCYSQRSKVEFEGKKAWNKQVLTSFCFTPETACESSLREDNMSELSTS